ncbi:hypothetical protein VCR1J2_400098 [Vibrio coralliirubri]|nr:hypothetical protein VCR1J2_400098 [Vibrio coralliirubri]
MYGLSEADLERYKFGFLIQLIEVVPETLKRDI